MAIKNLTSTPRCGLHATSCAAAWTPASYKDYVLFMLFIKYVSDKYGDYDEFEPPVVIPKGARFKGMVALTVPRLCDQADQFAGFPGRSRKSTGQSSSFKLISRAEGGKQTH